MCRMLQPLLETLMSVSSCVDSNHSSAIGDGVFLYEVMRRISIILFSAYYLLAVSGVTVHYHYCYGKLTSMDLYSPRKKPCPCGEKSAKSGCCEHQVLASKTDDAYKPDLATVGQPVLPEFPATAVPAIVLYLFPDFSAETSPKPYLSYWRSCFDIPLFLLYLVLRN